MFSALMCKGTADGLCKKLFGWMGWWVGTQPWRSSCLDAKLRRQSVSFGLGLFRVRGARAFPFYLIASLWLRFGFPVRTLLRTYQSRTMDWNLIYFVSHPLWMVIALLLAAVTFAQRRVRWDPRACPVQLTGKTAIVTGANTGIGKFIALDFARRGARVILACRNQDRGRAATEEIRQRSGNRDVHLRIVDTSSLESVRRFTAQILQEEKQLHILVNNAGASGLPPGITADGLEVTFATNHIGPFLLTSQLTDLMKRSAPARIVNVSSTNHKRGKVNFSHFRGENLTYTMDSVYNHTKLHNIIWTNELARRLQGTGVMVNSLHPGIVMTEVMRNYSWLVRFFFNLVGIFFFKSSEEGAVSTIYCALAEETEGITGKYFDSDCSLVLSAPETRDPAIGAKEFEHCERLTALP